MGDLLLRAHEETPPRAWGRRHWRRTRNDKAGNTPTCVGKTTRQRRRSRSKKKHPHVRGEDAALHSVGLNEWETPPRAWGRQHHRPSRKHIPRNTPTCVGKTSTAGSCPKCMGKHPHVRGEDASKWRSASAQGETPPRAWGRQTSMKAHIATWRNTPTCVGKTQGKNENSNRTQKHPHVRGEDIHTAPNAPCTLETPPRAWGRLALAAYALVALRNTPTCVGKTPTGSVWKLSKHYL